MGDCEHRELAAGYALGALDPGDAERYEAHLARCAECRSDVEAFRDPLLVLAHTAGPAEPPLDLRDRILADVAPPPRERRPVFDRLRVRRLAVGFAIAAATVLVLVFITLASTPGKAPSAEALLDEPVVSEIALAPKGMGRVMLGKDGKAVVEVTLPKAPSGKVYEAWVMRDGDAGRAEPAGLLAGGDTTAFVLSRRAHDGDVIGFTLEPDGGSPAPTTQPVATARA